MSNKPTLIVASHRTITDADVNALEAQISERNPEFKVIVIPQATGVVLIPADEEKRTTEPQRPSKTRTDTSPTAE